MKLFDRLRAMLGGVAPPPPEPDDGARAATQTYARREAYWARIGAVEDDLLTHLISPSFTGGPAWPSTRQAYRVVRRGGGLILATDGMADPFDGVQDGPNGFGMELFIETADIDPRFAGTPGDITGLKDGWAFEVLKQVADTIAGAGGVLPQIERYGVLSMEIPGVSQATTLPAQLPARFVTPDDSLGVLLGGPAPDFPAVIADMPLSPVHVVPVVLLTAAELAFLRAGGAEARHELARRLAATSHGHLSNLTRESMA